MTRRIAPVKDKTAELVDRLNHGDLRHRSTTRHDRLCSVDGGPRRHGVRGFFCSRCASLDPDTRLEGIERGSDARSGR